MQHKPRDCCVEVEKTEAEMRNDESKQIKKILLEGGSMGWTIQNAKGTGSTAF